jgi:hypothetical protein
MSEIAQKLFEGLKSGKDAVQSRIQESLSRLLPELTAEGKRLGTQGNMEMASGVFGNSAFVPYGPGQYTPTPDQQRQPDHSR